MGFTEEYKPLFQLHLLHNFHLASGGTAYDHTKLPDAFSNHHVKEYATIIPKGTSDCTKKEAEAASIRFNPE